MIEERLQVGEVEPIEEQDLLQKVANHEVMPGGVGSFLGDFIRMNQDIAGINVNEHSILKGFTFGTSDYTGAFKSGDITWNTETGAITGGSGIVMFRNGIIGAAAGVATFSIDPTTGAVILSGTITASAGSIGGWTIIAGYLYSLVSGTPTSSPSDGIVIKSGANAVITVYENTEKRIEMGYLSAGVFGMKGYEDDGATVAFEFSDTQKYINGANLGANTVASASVKPSLRGSSHDLVFSATDADTVAWASGTITLSDGTAYSIDAGNTGNMAARTYIYLDVDTSVTVLQTSTTFSDAVGEGKILIASAEDGTGEATFYVVGGIGGINIDANSIIVANLAALNADLGSITAGSISVVTGGNTVFLTPASATAIGSGPTGAPTFTVTQAGVMSCTGAVIDGTTTLNASVASNVQKRAEYSYNYFFHAGSWVDGLTEVDNVGGGLLLTRRIMTTLFHLQAIGAVYMYSGVLGYIIGDNMTWDLDYEFSVNTIQDTEDDNKDAFWGLIESGNTPGADKTDITKHIGFYLQDNTLYASMADGSTQETEEITGVTLTNWNNFYFIWDNGTNVKFYVNDVLKSTLSTNKPTGGIPIEMFWFSSPNHDADKRMLIGNNYFVAQPNG